MLANAVLLSQYKESRIIGCQPLPIIHSFGFGAEEGHRLCLSFLKKESKLNHNLIHFVEFSNLHNSDRISIVTQSNLSYKECTNIATKTMGFQWGFMTVSCGDQKQKQLIKSMM